MHPTYCLLALALGLMAACSSPKKHETPKDATAPQAQVVHSASKTAPAVQPSAVGPALSASPADRYIVPDSDAAKYYVGHEQASQAYYTPLAADVAALEAALPSFLRTSSEPEASAIASKLTDYRRQYLGAVVGGKRLVFGNFFCGQVAKNAKQVVIVDDGGSCYFNLHFDVSSGAFSKFYVNGNG